MGDFEKLSGAKGSTEYPTAPLFLEKTVKKHNILIGHDPVQVRFVEQFLTNYFQNKISCQLVNVVKDGDVLGKEEPQLYRVERPSSIDLSSHKRSTIGIWSLQLIENGSAGANAIIRFAASRLGMSRPSKEALAYISKEITNHLFDINAAIWYAARLLLNPIPERKNWPRPWENNITWLPKNEDVGYRLNTLYWELIEYVFAAVNDEKGFCKTGRPFRPKVFKYLSGLVLPKPQVTSTLEILSAWKSHGGDPYTCALKISAIWQRN